MTTQNPTVFLVLGVGWLSASLVRLISLFFGFYTNKNLMGVIFEGVIGALCAASIFF
jgi:hypothetical protein